MKCVVCHGTEVSQQTVEEEIRSGCDIVLVPVEALVCQSCGERYYNRSTMRKLEQITRDIKTNRSNLKVVGKVLKGV